MSAERFGQLLVLTREQDPALHRWLSEAHQRWQQGERLEQALELAGGRAVRLRDSALIAAADGLDPKGQLSTWARAGRLALRIGSFERAIWPRYRNDPTANSEGVTQALIQAFRLGVSIPRTQRSLYSVLKNSSEDFRKAG